MMGETAKAGFQTLWEMPAGTARSRNMLLQVLRLTMVAFSVTLMLSNAAHAGDDDDEDAQPEEGIVHNLIKGISGEGMDNSKINYRERSPLVVPPNLNLPPPVPKKSKMGANWPKDPDEQARREAIAASKEGPADPIAAARPLLPSEFAGQKRVSKQSGGKVEAAAPYVNYTLSPSELGYKGGIFSGMFGGNKEEKTTFKEEPKRESLTQPPSGYQTPSANYNYGTGPSNAKTQDVYNPITDKGTIQR